jgi:hypothetical protein
MNWPCMSIIIPYRELPYRRFHYCLYIVFMLLVMQGKLKYGDTAAK